MSLASEWIDDPDELEAIQSGSIARPDGARSCSPRDSSVEHDGHPPLSTIIGIRRNLARLVCGKRDELIRTAV